MTPEQQEAWDIIVSDAESHVQISVMSCMDDEAPSDILDYFKDAISNMIYENADLSYNEVIFKANVDATLSEHQNEIKDLVKRIMSTASLELEVD
jgi:hypothetical protein